VSASGNISVGDHVIGAGLPLAGQRVTLRLDGPVAHILSGGTVVRTAACPVPEQARARLRGARAGTTSPPRLPESFQVRRRVSVRGAIMIGRQRIQVGLPHAGKIADITVGSDTYQTSIEDDITITTARQNSRDIRRHKASNYCPARSGSGEPDHGRTRRLGRHQPRRKRSTPDRIPAGQGLFSQVVAGVGFEPT
jgi:hypothetical protein